MQHDTSVYQLKLGQSVILTNTGSGPAMGAKTDGRIETIRVDVPGAGWP